MYSISTLLTEKSRERRACRHSNVWWLEQPDVCFLRDSFHYACSPGVVINNIFFHCQKRSCLDDKLYGPPSHWDLVMVLKLLQEPEQGQPIMQETAFWTGKPSVIGCFSKCGLQVHCFSQLWSWVSTRVPGAHLGPRHSEPGGLFPQDLSHSKTLKTLSTVTLVYLEDP